MGSERLDDTHAGPDSHPRSTPSTVPGQILLGRYKVERVLGQGGMGTVLAARHVDLNQLVAFKFLHVTSNDDVVSRFLREAQAAAKLSGDHVAKVHDVGRLESGQPYMLMEHLSGEDLEHRLDRAGPLPIEDVVHWVLEACDAVAEAHRNGIVHRDLKPSNLFLHEPRTGKTILKVLDFGISKDLSTDAGKLTKTHAVLGSPLYMSPEQALAPRTVDARSDIWALGVVLYELATATPPFLGDTVPEIVAKILSHHPRRPSELNPSVPAWFDQVVFRCIAKHVEDRYASVDQLADALRSGALRSGSPESKGPSALAVTTMGSVPSAPFASRSEEAPQPALPLRTRRWWLLALPALVLTALVAHQLRGVAPHRADQPLAATAEETVTAAGPSSISPLPANPELTVIVPPNPSVVADGSTRPSAGPRLAPPASSKPAPRTEGSARDPSLPVPTTKPIDPLDRL